MRRLLFEILTSPVRVVMIKDTSILIFMLFCVKRVLNGEYL
jgi:hypothetical protein